MEELAKILNQNGIDTTSLELLEAVGEEKIYYFSVPRKSSVEFWKKVRLLVNQTGYSPVISREKDDLQIHLQKFKDNSAYTVANILKESKNVNPTEWLREEYDNFFYEDDNDGIVRGEWPEGENASNYFSIPGDTVNNKASDEIFLGLIPTRISWQIPAYIQFGDFNSCPSSAIHVSIMKRWWELYRIEIVGMLGDTIECIVPRPPQTREQALELAKEQFAYCSDIVVQGVGTIENLAATLLKGKTWYFWWD
jgi:hypothetical protein